MRKPNPALESLHDFARDCCAFGAIVLFVAAFCVWLIYLRQPPPVPV